MNAVSNASFHLTLAEFSRGRRVTAPDCSSRVTALLLTATLAGLLVLLATHQDLWRSAIPAPSEIVTMLVRDRPQEKIIPPPPPVPVELIRPRAEQAAAPAFTVAPDTPPAPAQLPATAAKTSAMAGGSPAGTGTGAGGAAGNGAGGNGKGVSSCWDPAWARAGTNRVRHFFYYPSRARDQNVTGMVVVRMTVLRNGMLESLDIAKSSGDTSLDAAAFNIMKKSQPLPRIPDRMHLDKVSALFPLYFGAVDTSTDAGGNCKS
jgi:protein TonB